MAPVIRHDALAQAGIGSFLFALDDCRVDLHAARIDIFREALGGDLAGHFGNEFGVHCVIA